MSAALASCSAGEVLAQVQLAQQLLSELDPDCCTDAEIAELLRATELSRRLADSADLGLVAQMSSRGLHALHGCSAPKVFLQHLLRIPGSEATVRVKNAATLGPRHSLHGEPLDPIFEATAAALAQGAITARAAGVVVKTVDALPGEVQAEIGVTVEQQLVDYARHTDVVELAKFASALRDRLDQDGRWKDLDKQHRRRTVSERRRADGSSEITIHATCELAELWRAVMDAFSAPQPARDGTPDPRTYGQRVHDGLIVALRLLLEAGTTPSTGGCRTTVILTGDITDFATNTATMTTGHGVAVPVELAKSWLEPDARAILVLLSMTQGIEAYSTTHRLFTEQQRLAMIARDGGCSYWGCDVPAAWCQAHHVVEYRTSARTRVDQGALVCGRDHRSFESMGYRNQMINGIPHWIPPTWIDQHQTPLRNTRHQL